MKLLGGLIVLLFIVMGFGCIWGACEGAWEMITVGAETRVDMVGNWFMIVFVFICGLACLATAPAMINEM